MMRKNVNQFWIENFLQFLMRYESLVIISNNENVKFSVTIKH